MLKLKHAVNSFVITKKKFNKNKRMRGGAQAAAAVTAEAAAAAKVAAVKPLFGALTDAIETEFKNCTEGIDDALQTKSAENKILLNKKRILIPILLDDFDLVQQKIPDSKITDESLNLLRQTILINIVNKTEPLNTQLAKIEAYGINPELPDPIKDIYTSDNISPLSRIKKILALFVIKDGTIVPVENIEEAVREANTKYQAFLDQVAAKSNSIGSNAGSTTTVAGGMTFTANIPEGCKKGETCNVKVQQQGGGRKTRNKRRKGVRKSQNKKILKGGRRRR